MIPLLVNGTSDFSQRLSEILNRGEAFEARFQKDVDEILRKVKKEGDSAVAHYTKRFDGIDLYETGFYFSPEELSEAINSLSPELKEAIEKSCERILDFHLKQREESWFTTEKDGSILGQRVIPLERVGIYVPGGRASYPSSVLMNALPAKAAGVKEIIMCTPTPHGFVNKTVLAAAKMAGVNKVFRIGGAQAIGAMAYGTQQVPKVDKIVGPGNIFVALAKRQVFGTVGIDMVAGPSEILVLADDTANPAFVAADLLSQAEHDPLASSILITTSRELADSVVKEVEAQLKALPKPQGEVAKEAIEKFGAVLVVESLRDMVELANDIAPEHLEIITGDPWEIMPLIKNAGAIFLGQYSTEPIGDYIAGPNHVLPTGGSARFSSPLNTGDFVKKSSIIQVREELFSELATHAVAVAEEERLIAHRRAIEIRRGSNPHPLKKEREDRA